MKRLALELGGNAPFLVFADADLDSAVAQLMGNKFRCSGQTCVCTNRVLVQAPVAEAFAGKITGLVAGLEVGPGAFPNVTIGPLIDRRGFDKVQSLVADALARGARAAVGGPASEPSGGGCFFPPTVLVDVTAEMACSRDEVFGPVVAISTFDDEADAVRRANDTPYGLAAYVFTADPARAQRVAARLHFGHVGLNTASGPTPEAPFGGMGLSGIGREGGLEGVLEFIELQTTPIAD
jgi:succinate-semialdehyde dehydrogenase/glutarate-semialdehyde dehydrogenase